MTDLHDKFHTLDRIPAPDLWSDVQRRADTLADTSVGPVVGRLGWRGSQTERRPGSLQWLVLVVVAALLAVAIALAASHRSAGGPLVFVSNSRVFAVDVGRRTTTTIFQEPTTAGRELSISPDGRHVAFLWEREGGELLVIANADGSGFRTFGPVSILSGAAAWAPDGRTFAWVGRDEAVSGKEPFLILLDTDGTVRQRIKVPVFAGGIQIVWAADNHQIALLMNGMADSPCPPFGTPRLDVVDTLTASVREIGDRLRVGSVAWSHDGTHLVASLAASGPAAIDSNCGTGRIPSRLVSIDPTTGRVEVLAGNLGGAVASLAWSLDDSAVQYAIAEESVLASFAVWRAPVNAGQPLLLARILADGPPVWSPDVSRLDWFSEESMWSVDIAGGDPRRLADHVATMPDVAWPKWSPDGSWIAFLREQPGREPEPASTEFPHVIPEPIDSLWVIRSDGTDEHLLVDDTFDLDVDW